MSIFFLTTHLLSRIYKKGSLIDINCFPQKRINTWILADGTLTIVLKEKKSMSKHFKNRGGGFFLMCGKTLGPWEIIDQWFFLVNTQLYCNTVSCHSSEIWGLCLMKCPSNTLHNLPYFWNTKTTYMGFHNLKIWQIF